MSTSWAIACNIYVSLIVRIRINTHSHSPTSLHIHCTFIHRYIHPSIHLFIHSSISILSSNRNWYVPHFLFIKIGIKCLLHLCWLIQTRLIRNTAQIFRFDTWMCNYDCTLQSIVQIPFLDLLLFCFVNIAQICFFGFHFPLCNRIYVYLFRHVDTHSHTQAISLTFRFSYKSQCFEYVPTDLVRYKLRTCQKKYAVGWTIERKNSKFLRNFCANICYQLRFGEWSVFVVGCV